jgi:hypothetical protein
MLKSKLVYKLIVAIVFFTCIVSNGFGQNNLMKFSSLKGNFNFELVDEVILSSEIDFQPVSMNNVDFNSEIIVMSTTRPATLSIYDRASGKQISVIDKKGYGPFEFQNITYIKLVDDLIFINCSTNGLIGIDLTGNGVRQINYPSQSTSHFDIDNNHELLVVYNNSSVNKYFVTILNFDAEVINDEIGLGTDNDIWLQTFMHAGGIVLDNPNIIHAQKDELKIHLFNIDTGKEISYSYNNDRYRKYSLNKSRDQVQNDPMLMINYVMDRSIISAVYQLSKGYVIELDHRIRDGDNYSELMILNSEFEHIDSIILPTDFQKSVGEFSLNNNMDEIVYFNADKASGEYKVSIFKLLQN